MPEQNTVGRFSDRVEDYVKYRPSYPPDAVSAVLDGLGPPEHLVAADVGAGTGISARLLGDRGVRVVAVEPGQEMRAAAESHQRVSWIAGKAEALGLQSEAFGLVLCAQSFHWFRPAEVLPEFARVLKRGGRLALVWNRRSNSDALTEGYRRAILDVAGEVTAERMAFDARDVADTRLFSPPNRTSVPNVQRLDLDGLIGRARSASYVPKSGHEGERMLALLRALYDRHADPSGFVSMIYETEIYTFSKL